MKESNSFNEIEVRRLLTGNGNEIGQGVALIEHYYRQSLCRWVRERFPSLPREDVVDIWGETLVCILKAAHDRRFEADRPLLPWLCKIARARAIDFTRSRTTRENALTGLGRLLRRPAVRVSDGLPLAVRENESLGLIHGRIATLPVQQRVVLQVYVDHFPDSTRMEVLRREVSQVTGHAETLASVKRALQEGRRKLRDHLRRNGYDVGQRGPS